MLEEIVKTVNMRSNQVLQSLSYHWVDERL